MKSDKKIAVVDFGGQYAHLIASRVRRLGAYTEIITNEEPAETYQNYAGIILSGGPASVYETNAPTLPEYFFKLQKPILGICYGHQLLMQKLGGQVVSSTNKEYGPARLKIDKNQKSLLSVGIQEETVVWMSHGDEVTKLPEGFSVKGESDHCQYAFVSNEEHKIYGIQFHPEVTHSREGNQFLSNFIRLCEVSNSWSLESFLDREIQILQQKVPLGKNVFLLVSGGVDSSVAYLLLAKALGKERVKGLLVDTGFMRKNEVRDLKSNLNSMGFDLTIWDASKDFYRELQGKSEPEEKRRIVGDLFLKVQAQAVESMKLDSEHWILGQGTIYPDTIESGGTKHSHKIKTHHNRVPAIQTLIDQGKIVEPIADLYKDEVRELGKLLGLPQQWIERHPFPGPGLVVRMIASKENRGEEILPKLQEVFGNSDSNLSFGILPIQSVGVQGDQRSYAHAAVIAGRGINWKKLDEISQKVTNAIKEVNRVVFMPGVSSIPNSFTYTPVHMDQIHSNLLRDADDIVNEILFRRGIQTQIWQMPVVLIPAAVEMGTYGIVLRPVQSEEAMTANFYEMDMAILTEIKESILKLNQISAVFYDLTHKPPGTIEWE